MHANRRPSEASRRVDPAGEIAWESATYRHAGRADAHVIEILTEASSPAYRDYLCMREYAVRAGEAAGSSMYAPSMRPLSPAKT